MKLLIFIMCWFVISYIILFNSRDQILREDLGWAKCFAVYIIYLAAGPIFLLNNVFLIILSFIDEGGGYDEY